MENSSPSFARRGAALRVGYLVVGAVAGLCLTHGAALAATVFDGPQCVSHVDPEVGMIGFMPPGSLDRNDATILSLSALPKVAPGDLVRVKRIAKGTEGEPTVELIQAKAAKCAAIRTASAAEAAHHAGHGAGDPAPAR